MVLLLIDEWEIKPEMKIHSKRMTTVLINDKNIESRSKVKQLVAKRATGYRQHSVTSFKIMQICCRK